jgi:hypothetical protein
MLAGRKQRQLNGGVFTLARSLSLLTIAYGGSGKLERQRRRKQ